MSALLVLLALTSLAVAAVGALWCHGGASAGRTIGTALIVLGGIGTTVALWHSEVGQGVLVRGTAEIGGTATVVVAVAAVTALIGAATTVADHHVVYPRPAPRKAEA